MNSKGNFQKNCYFHNFRSQAKKHRRLCLYICLERFSSVYLAISVWIYLVLTAMKRGDEALNASFLQFLSSVKRFIASSLRFFLSVKRFIAVIFYGKPSFNASSPLLLKRSSSFNASSPLLFKLTLPTSGNMHHKHHCHYELFMTGSVESKTQQYRKSGYGINKWWLTCFNV